MLELFITIKGKINQWIALRSAEPSAYATGKSMAYRFSGYLILSILGIVAFSSLVILVMIIPVNLVQRFVTITELRTPAEIASSEVSDKTIHYKNLVNEELGKSLKSLSAYTPTRPYLVINTTTNTFQLFSASELLREGSCSTGSYVRLQGKDQEWIFKTPKGFQTIKGKAKNPVWKKPDWAFVEEGMQVPSINHFTRFEYGVLGNYALYMGDGYMIHGTLYQRLIGLPVTHGCIRLGDEDLEAVYKTLAPNSKVFIL